MFESAYETLNHTEQTQFKDALNNLLFKCFISLVCFCIIIPLIIRYITNKSSENIDDISSSFIFI